VAAYESGAKSPNTATLERLVRASGFDIDAQLRPRAEFEDRVRRGRELLEVLDLADELPTEHRSPPRKRFPKG
jgi:hypothetical protein